MKWHFDLSQAPKGREVTHHYPDGRGGDRREVVWESPTLLLATKCGKVIKSRWLPPSHKERRPVGRWEFMQAGEDPVAFAPWPAHPNEGALK